MEVVVEVVVGISGISVVVLVAVEDVAVGDALLVVVESALTMAFLDDKAIYESLLFHLLF